LRRKGLETEDNARRDMREEGRRERGCLEQRGDCLWKREGSGEGSGEESAEKERRGRPLHMDIWRACYIIAGTHCSSLSLLLSAPLGLCAQSQSNPGRLVTCTALPRVGKGRASASRQSVRASPRLSMLYHPSSARRFMSVQANKTLRSCVRRVYLLDALAPAILYRT